MNVEALKKQAAVEAVNEIKDEKVIGLGTGSTTRYAVEEIGLRLKDGRLRDIVGVATSENTRELAERVGIPLMNINDVEKIDLTIDGADEVDDNLQLVKGRGGALFREKMTELLTTKFIVIVDQTKRVSKLGEKCPIPVEVVRFGYLSTQRRLSQFGTPVLRSDPHDSGKPYVTDNGNYILDLAVSGGIEDPAKMDRDLKTVTGVVDHGIFINMATKVIIAAEAGIQVMTK
ncbi:ribose 5-phosphate isomerase [Blastocystis sp. subtype 4]|uniref:ribose 5-phosphate isomerase n=1 Tax=Blastocystis sp. subtype 4 TaxID=944170 RepID=UPI0007121F95|nr:ribose 5-phosphate isomerase [Blastocystis sp. subtype 4]KNB41378.1 ribose 5-phosphate isomerase [Blastocystis sp. subtype 4]|eukprot:XP_014524821.1 ribose 5-phosphate isomerase [Blastocystis sp. subtype 4]